MKTPTANKLSSGRWRAQVEVKGVRHSITRDTKKEAERVATLLKLSPAQRAQKMTYREAIDAYIDKYTSPTLVKRKKLSPSTVKGYRDIQRQRFQSIMDLPVSTSLDMQSIVDREDVSAKTLKNAYGLISAVLRDMGLDPPKVKYPQEEKEERPFLDSDQIKIFLKAIEGDRYELPYLLCLHSLRRSEMLAMKKNQIRNNTIYVRGAMVLGEDGMVLKDTNKTPASVREIPIFIPRLATLVKTAPDGFLCPYSVKGMENHLRRILRRLELPVSGFHMLRHSYASICWAAGVTDLACMKWGGWSDYRTMRQIYTHLAEKQEQADIEKLRNALAE